VSGKAAAKGNKSFEVNQSMQSFASRGGFGGFLFGENQSMQSFTSRGGFGGFLFGRILDWYNSKLGKIIINLIALKHLYCFETPPFR
jgi:hypothetical protein